MNLLQLRTEVLATGFDATVFASRINTYLNDAQNRVARLVDYYGSEGVDQFATVSGTAIYGFPADFARSRDLFNTDLNYELHAVGLRDIDRSAKSNGQPRFFAIDGPNLHLYPTPDGIYNLEMRYWKMPAPLVADTDVPSLPADYHSMLISYALYRCYEREDDPQQAQYHQGQWKSALAEFATDIRFPTSEEPMQVRGWWEREPSLGAQGWSLYTGGY